MIWERRLTLRNLKTELWLAKKAVITWAQLRETKSGQLIIPVERSETDPLYLNLFFIICVFGGSGAKLLGLIPAVRMWASNFHFLTHQMNMKMVPTSEIGDWMTTPRDFGIVLGTKLTWLAASFFFYFYFYGWTGCVLEKERAQIILRMLFKIVGKCNP